MRDALLFLALAYLCMGIVVTTVAGIIAHGQGEPRWIWEAVKIGAVWPYWLARVLL